MSDLLLVVAFVAWLVVMGLYVTNLVNTLWLDDLDNYRSKRGWLGRIKGDRP